MERWSDEIVEIADDATNDFMERIGNPKPGAVPTEMVRAGAVVGQGDARHASASLSDGRGGLRACR